MKQGKNELSTYNVSLFVLKFNIFFVGMQTKCMLNILVMFASDYETNLHFNIE